MKKDIARYVAEYPNSQQVKAEHHRLGSLAQDIEIPTFLFFSLFSISTIFCLLGLIFFRLGFSRNSLSIPIRSTYTLPS